jgi:RNA polymerase sigma-70 factor, ECF subfamily
VSVVERPAPSDERLIAGLRRGDEAAFAELIERYSAPLIRLAAGFVRDRAVAEEVVQETWLAVLQGIDRFEARSSLKTWVYRILTNKAKTRGERERRSVPFSSLAPADEGPSVDPDRFLGPDHHWAGHWSVPPPRWDEIPEERLLGRETLACAQRAIDALPLAQRQVITLRDVEGWDSEDVCELLGLSEGNQRVLLHRARTKVRLALETELAPPGTLA